MFHFRARIALLALAILASASPALSQTTVTDTLVTDTLDVSFTVETIYFTHLGGVVGCSNYIVGEHADPLGQGLDSDYRYATFRDGSRLDRLRTNPNLPPEVDPGDIPGVRISSAYGGNSAATCRGEIIAQVHAFVPRLAGSVATYSRPEGPVALFNWEQTEGLTVRFDGTESRVVTPSGRRPVSSYAWTYGDPATTAVTEHTFEQPGDYDVTLTVTDGNGNQDSITQTVTVTGHQLTVKALPVEPDRLYSLGDTIVVETTVTNTGANSVLDVTVPPYTEALSDAPDSPPTASVALPRLTRMRTREPEMRGVLGVGESIVTLDSFRVDRYARYALDGETFLAEVRAWAEMPATIEASSGISEPVLIKRPCAGGACETWQVGPDLNIDLRLVTTASDDASSVLAGITYNAATEWAGFLNVDSGRPGNAADDITCMSGCVELVAMVTDKEGAPVEGAQVRFVASALSGESVATVSPRGSFICEKGRGNTSVVANCRGGTGEYQINVTTAADGEARAIYSTQGVLDAAEVLGAAATELEAKAIEGGGIADEMKKPLAVEQNRIFDSEQTLTGYDSAFLLSQRQFVVLGGAGNPIGEYCENSVKKIKEAVPVASAVEKNVAYYGINVATSYICDGFLSKASNITAGGRKVLDWLTGEGGVGANADALKKVGSASLYLWALNAYTVKNPHALSLASGPNPPPAVFFFDGEFFDFTVDAMQALVGEVTYDASGTPIARDLTGVRTRLRIYDLSTRKREASPGVISTNFLRGHVELAEFTGGGWTVVKEADIEFFYLPHLFVGPSRKEWLKDKFGVVDRDATAGELTISAGGSTSGRSARDASSKADYAVGDILLVGDGPEAELNQVASVEGAEVGLVLPLGSDHPVGAPVTLFAEGIAAAPPPPLLVANFRGNVDLGWSPHASTLVASYDIQIATDAGMANRLLDEAGVPTTRAPISPGVFTEGQTYYWRVRSVNRLGTSEWTDVFPFTPTSAVVTPNEDASERLPAELTLSAYPNPASGTARLVVEAPTSGYQRVTLYDALGRQVAVLAEGERPAGRHELAIQVSGLPAGVYVLRAESGGEAAMQRFTVVR